jgi:hypothetical protein
MGERRFYEFLTATFRNRALVPTENHRLQPQLPFNAALTTNFD